MTRIFLTVISTRVFTGGTTGTAGRITAVYSGIADIGKRTIKKNY
jgi:hypothetical protein